MNVENQIRRLRRAGCVIGLNCLALLCCRGAAVRAAGDTTLPSKPRSAQKKVVALSPWEQAERGRDALETSPEDGRMKADYARAMDAYRAIYHASPGDVHAPAAVNAVAELLAEQGRSLRDAKSLQAAVGQYEFLRTQYPGSSLRVQALLAEGQIEQNDLGDAGAAREKYTLLVKDYPKSGEAEEARAALASLAMGLGLKERSSGKMVARTDSSLHTSVSASTSGPSVLGGEGHARAPVADPPGVVTGGSLLPAMAQTSLVQTSIPQTSFVPPSAAAGVHSAVRTGAAKPIETVDLAAVDAETMPAGGDAAVAKKSGNRALVTGIRHWSTSTYTRVAIDLGDNVTYEAARVPNPDRIYFDLHGTRLAPELVGKSFAVTDDGFLKKIRAAQYADDVTRVVLDVNDVTEYSAFLLPNPARLIIDIHGRQDSGLRVRGADGADDAAAVAAPRAAAAVKSTAAKPVPNTVAIKSSSTNSDVAGVSDVPGRVEATTKPTSKPISAVVGESSADSMPRSAADDAGTHVADAGHGAPNVVAPNPRKGKVGSGSTALVVATPARAAVPTADGETSLVRALGLKIGRIVIDAGHGGHDSGTLGADGIEEKDVVLDVALRLGKLLHDRLGAEIIYTRSDDTFVPLETRTAIANKAQADLFLSIHANSSSDATARGVETYYLNFTSDPTALEVAARENAVSDQSIHQLSDLVKKIALKDKIAESREFASDVEGSLYAGLQKGNDGLKDRGVKKAPFVVLIGANMPSILAEISFVTNPQDAGQMREPEYRQRVAESLYRGVARYEGGLSGTRVPTERAAGQ
jgi:N-acetylmuramoyl-L-alanine amidase